jgi:uncharacterized membrane protein YdbT with pleckstrin-like domain
MDIKEPIIKEFHPHRFYNLAFYFGGAVFLILGIFVSWYLILVGILVVVAGEVVRMSETFYVLESGVSRQYKLLHTSRDFTEYGKIQNIKVRQSFIENMLGIGNIHIDTAGNDGSEINFHGVVDPYGVEHIIREKMKVL